MYVGKVIVYVFATVDSQIGRKSLWQSMSVSIYLKYVYVCRYVQVESNFSALQCIPAPLLQRS